MPNFPFDVVVFDLDGTLVDSAPDIAAALNHSLRALDRPEIRPDRVRDLIGDGARALLRRGLAASGEAPEALIDAAWPIFIDYYRGHIADGTRAYPGIEAALDRLRAEGAAIAVCTNKIEALTLPLLDALGWADRFDAVVGGDTLALRKPDPAPLREAIARAGGGSAILVGDSITDADTARAAGVPFVAVSFGYADRAVDQLGAKAVIDDFQDLFEALRRL